MGNSDNSIIIFGESYKKNMARRSLAEISYFY